MHMKIDVFSTGGEATCGDEGDFDVSVDETLPPFDLSFGHGM